MNVRVTGNIVRRSAFFVVGGLIAALLAAVLGITILWTAVFSLQNALGFMTGGDTQNLYNTTDMPLIMPSGFSISVFVGDLKGLDQMAWGPDGELLVSIHDKDIIVVIKDVNWDGIVEGRELVDKKYANYFYEKNEGLIFIPKIGWPEHYASGFLRVNEGGDKIVLIKEDDDGNIFESDFISGWDGEPKSFLIKGGADFISELYVSNEDGNVYRINYGGGQAMKF